MKQAKSPPIRVFLVDDHRVVRSGTKDMLSLNAQIEVVGEADSGEQLQQQLGECTPDVVLLDVNLPGKNGLQILQETKAQWPAMRVVLFSAFTEWPYIRQALQHKADGYLSKLIDEKALHHAILQVARTGNPVFSADVQATIQHHGNEPVQPLTAREHEILQLVVQGQTNQAIAKALSISVKTVDTHLSHLMRKAGAQNRTQLSHKAQEKGFL